ncbi:ATP-grasp domain-containing protein [Pseudidiomarina sp.]|uniref:ATP-grasp domain-containing protein n=1 Tax=Pseudidiomarina sp. TaxID=2081707 RepID=UPI003A96C550
MNILITSAGRRVELVESFQNAVAVLGLSQQTKVFCADLEPKLSSACVISDKAFALPLAKSEEYPEALLKLCLDREIKLVIPTNDNELPIFAKHRQHFQEHGVKLIISDTQLVEKCRDKRLTGDIFDLFHIRYPNIYQTDAIRFPCFCKPYDGSSSVGAHIINSNDELNQAALADPKNMFMELIPKRFKEYTVDAYFDAENTLRGLVPRERLAVRAGEVAKGITRKNYVYKKLRESISVVPGAIGCLTIQVFGDPETEEIVGLEVNPRFGGGYPLSVAAGADYSKKLIEEYLLGERVGDLDNWRDNLLMLRYDAKVVVDNA